MGAHFSRDAYARLRERVNTLTLKDMRAAAAAPTDWRAVSAVTADTTVEALVDRLASAPGGACVVLDPTGQKVVGSVDLFHVARFVLALYEGSTEHREIAVEHEAFDFWLGWERWIERRIAEVPSPNAEAVLRTGAATFFSVTVAEVLASPGLRAFSRVTYPDEAISDTALVAQALPLWARGFANLLLKTADGEYCFLSAADVLSALWTGVLRTNLQGVGAIRFKKLGVSSHVVYSVEMGQRALQAFRLMSDRGVQAVPIVGGTLMLWSSSFVSLLRHLQSMAGSRARYRCNRYALCVPPTSTHCWAALAIWWRSAPSWAKLRPPSRCARMPPSRKWLSSCTMIPTSARTCGWSASTRASRASCRSLTSLVL